MKYFNKSGIINIVVGDTSYRIPPGLNSHLPKIEHPLLEFIGNDKEDSAQEVSPQIDPRDNIIEELKSEIRNLSTKMEELRDDSEKTQRNLDKKNKECEHLKSEILKIKEEIKIMEVLNSDKLEKPKKKGKKNE